MVIEKLIKVAGDAIEKVLPGEEARQAREQFQLQLASLLLQQDKQLRDFFLAYEGKAHQVPRGIQIARMLIRPFFTWLFGILGAAWVIGQAMGWVHGEMPGALSTWVTLTLGFWFGSRIVEKTRGLP